MLEPRQSETPPERGFFWRFSVWTNPMPVKSENVETRNNEDSKVNGSRVFRCIEKLLMPWTSRHFISKQLGKHHFELRWLDFPPGSIYSKERWKSGSLSRQVQDKYVSKSHSFPKLARIKSSPQKRYVSCHFDYVVFDCQRHQHHLGGFGTSSCQPQTTNAKIQFSMQRPKGV